MRRVQTACVALAVLAAGWSLSGCGGRDAPYRIGVLMSSMQQSVYFFMHRAMAEAAAADGVELLWLSSDNLERKEGFYLDGLLASDIDVLIYQPVNERTAGPRVDRLLRNGIPVVALDRLPYDAQVAAYITADSRQVGRLQAECLAEALGGHGRILILSGDQASRVAEEITAGNLEVFDRFPGMTVAQQTYHFRWSRQLAMLTTREALATAGRIDGIVANNSSEAMGAVAALREKGLSGTIPIVGADADFDACLAVLDGEMLAEVDKRPIELGMTAYEVALTLARGEVPQAEHKIPNGRFEIPVVLTPVRLITKQNLLMEMSYRWSALALAE